MNRSTNDASQTDLSNTSLDQDALKQSVAQAALDYLLPKLKPTDVLGIGTGTTANCFIDLLAQVKTSFRAAVASSEASAKRLESHDIPVIDLNEIDRLAAYIDGADESNAQLELIKGGGAALTREKIVASCADEFICIADERKWVTTLGNFPLPVEVLPMARNAVIKKLEALGGRTIHRHNVITDNGGEILDVHDLIIDHPIELESHINQIPGVVTNGLFAQQPADILFLGCTDGVKILHAK